MKIKGFAMSGKIGAGKSTVCEKIVATAPDRIVKVSFAGPLKTLAVQALGRPLDKAIDRKFLQNLGMGMRSEELHNAGYDSLIAFLLESKPVLASSAEPYISFNAAMQNYCWSTRWGYTNHWADQMTLHLGRLANRGVEVVVIEDMRFLNEHAVATDMGLKSLRVQCDEEVRIARLMARDGKYDSKVEEDASELEWPNIPVDIILNTTCEEDIDEEIERIVQTIFS